MAQQAPELPAQIPTAAAIEAAQHMISHGHDGIDPVQHFLGALVDALGLADKDLAAAERAVVQAFTAHPRDDAAIKKALRDLRRVKAKKA
jgi:hypothetical protein